MPSVLYPGGSEGLLDRSIDLDGDVRAMLVGAGYQFDDGHRFVADINRRADNGRSDPLSGKSYGGGAFDAADTPTIAARAEQVQAIVLFQHTGDDKTARLIVHIADAEAGLPFVPAAGQRISIEWDNGPDRIFRI